MRRWLVWTGGGVLALLIGTSAGCNRPSQKESRAHKDEQGGISARRAAKNEDKATQTLTLQWRIKPICIDAGHGGRDSGTAAPDGTLEKELVLDLACRVRDGLTRHGATVIMTRDDDSYVALGRRARISNDAKAGLFVSLHANGYHEPQVAGFEVHYYDRGDASTSAEVAETIRKKLAARLSIRDRGIRRSGFEVLSATRCPAVLVEVGYLTNPEERERLRDDEYRRALAEAVVAGIIEYATDDVPDMHREEQP